MLCQLKVHNIVKEPGRVNLLGTFELSAFIIYTQAVDFHETYSH